MIYDGDKRVELLFQKNGVAHSLFKNIKRISDVDYNESLQYRDWLLNIKIPRLKTVLEDAIYKQFKYDEENFWKTIDIMDCKFKKFEKAIKEEYNELDFLRGYS